MNTTIFLALILVHYCFGNFVLKFHKFSRNKRQTNSLPTFVDPVTWNSLECDGIPFLQNGSSYLFGSEPFPAEFTKLLSEAYQKISKTKKAVKDKLVQSLNKGKYYNSLQAASILSDRYVKYGLEKTVIYVYTTYYIYAEMNNALRKQGTNTKLSHKQKGLAPFALVLNAILFNWTPLKSIAHVTYRKFQMTEEDIAKYSVGTEFAWVSFTASSKNRTVSVDYYKGNVLFIFDNSKLTNWRPKDIHQYSFDPSHQEALFPSGARFKVMSVKPSAEKAKGILYDIDVSLTSQRPSESSCTNEPSTGILLYEQFNVHIVYMCIILTQF